MQKNSFSRAARRRFLGMAAVLMVGAPAAIAAPIVTNWTGLDNSGSWTDPANWSNGAPVSNYSATFNGAGNGFTSISLGGAAQPINTVAFASGAAAYTIGATTGDALTFDAGGAISVASGVTAAQMIPAGITTSGALTVTNAGTGGLTLSGSIGLGGNMTVTNTGSTALTTISGVISGSSSIIPGGGGTIIFTGNNTGYSGLVNLSSGTATNIGIGSNTAFGTGIIQPNNGTNSPLQAVGGDRTVANQINMATGFTVNDATAANGGAHNLTLTGPLVLTSTSGRSLTFNNLGQVCTIGASADSSTITLGTASNENLTISPTNNAANTTPSIVVFNDIIQDNSTPPATPNNIVYAPATNGPEGDVLINGDNTYSGTTTFNGQTSGTFVSLICGIGVSSVGAPGSIVSGPFGKGTVTINASNNPPIFVPYGADRTVANALVMTSGFQVANAPTTGTGITVDPAGTTHNLFFTGPVTDSGKVITNNMQPGVAFYLGSSSTSSIITMTGTTKIQSQLSAAGAGTTMIYDQLTSTGALTVQINGTVDLMNSSNNYTGATSVIGAGTGATAVGTGGTLGGTGMVPGTTTIGSATAATQGGIIAPGVGGAGTINVGSMILNPFGRYAFDYNATDGTVGSGVNDLINGTGTLDLSALSSSAPFDLNLNPIVTGSGATSYILADFAGGIINTGSPYTNGTDVSSLFTFSGTSPFTPFVLVVADPSGTGQDLELTNSVPEPGSLALLGLAAVATMRRRRD